MFEISRRAKDHTSYVTMKIVLDLPCVIVDKDIRSGLPVLKESLVPITQILNFCSSLKGIEEYEKKFNLPLGSVSTFYEQLIRAFHDKQ